MALFHKLEVSIETMRIFTVSDLHIDYKENAQWLNSLSLDDYQDDILILAGDISDNAPLLEHCFKQLSQRFHKVLYVPGNHDLWVTRSPQKDSLEKFAFVQMLAQQSDIGMHEYRQEGLSIVPLLGWYDYSFGTPSDHLKKSWSDFYACKWPHGFTEKEITEFFIKKNQPLLAVQNNTVITFSHFLPRIDLMPQSIPNKYHFLYPALGSTLIEKQIREIQPKIHIYGHSHINQSVLKENIYYINNAFGTPSESRIALKKLLCIFEI